MLTPPAASQGRYLLLIVAIVVGYLIAVERSVAQRRITVDRTRTASAVVEQAN